MSELEKRLAALSPEKRDALLKQIRQKQNEKHNARILPRKEASNELPLSFVQERLWFLHQLDPGNMAYHVPTAVRLHGTVSLAIVQQSLTHIAQRHEIFRTTFQSYPSGPVQVIADTPTVPMRVVDLQHLASEQQDALVTTLIQHDAECAFHLESGPLFRSCMLRFSEHEHLLLLSLHHIIYDDWSANILMQEFITLYHAFSQGQTAQLAPLSIQYADYALWQRNWMQGSVLRQQLDYWRAQLEGVPAMLDLPLDCLREGIYNQQFRSQTVLLSPKQSEQLKQLSQQLDVTLFMTLLTALKTVLYQWSGQSDIAVGTVVAGRGYTELEPLIGCFLNFLTLRTQLEPDMQWKQLALIVKTMVLDAYTHQDVPFEKVVAELQPDRTRYHNPFYNVAFILQNALQRQGAFHTDDLTLELLPLPPRDALLDLRFNGVETEEGLRIVCEYDASLFHDTTIRVLLEAYQQVLQQIINDASTPLDAFMLPDRLRQQASRARRREQKQTLAIAATFTAEPLEESLSYWMRELQLPTTINFAAYQQVLQQLLDPQSLLATNTEGINVILLRFEDWLRFSQREEQVSSARRMLEPLLDEFIQAVQQFVPRSSVPCLLGICPPSPQMQVDVAFRLFWQEMEQRLVQGVCQLQGMSVISSSELASKYPVADYYDDYTDKAGHIPFTPHFFTALGTLIARKIAALTFLPYKAIVVECDQTLWHGACGEDGPQGIIIDPARRALQAFLVAQQEAGMLICLNSKNTEQDVFAVFDAHPEMPLKREHLAQVRINWQPQAENLRSLAQELNLSLESMIFVDDHPLAQAEVQAQCPEVLVFPFPAQIEQLPPLLDHFWAFDQVMRTAEDRQRTSYYQQEQQEEAEPVRSTSTMLEEGERLHPTQLLKIATTLRRVEQIYPYIQSQKPRRTVHQQHSETVATDIEQELLKIWSDLLKLDDVRTSDNFFAVGGHSLLATRLLSQVRTVFQVELPLQSIFEDPTIVGLAQRIEQKQQEARKQRQPAPALVPQPHSEEVPLAFAQERLWFLQQLEPESTAYHMPAALRLQGPLHIAALTQSLKHLHLRHEILRTSFSEREGRVMQVIAATATVRVPVIDLRAIALPEREPIIHSLAQQEEHVLFNLATGPLLRVSVLQLDEQEHVVLLTMHHIISDGWSMGVLIRELSALYHAEIAQATVQLPALPIQYADYALWQRARLQGEVLEEQLAYWRAQLVAAPALLELPTDRPRPAVQTFVGKRQSMVLPSDLQQQLMALSQREGVTLFMTLLAAFQVLLMRYSGQEDIVVGTPIANRTQRELESLIGFFVNTLVLRTDLSGNPSFLHLLARVRDVTLGAYAHQDLPFERLVDELSLERSLSYTPLFQVLFVLQNAPQEELKPGDLSWQSIKDKNTSAKFDLTFELEETAQGLHTIIEYNTDLFDGTTIERMLGHWQTLLQGIVSDATQDLATLPLLSTQEQQQLLVDWQSTATTATDEPAQLLHELIEAQVARTPDAVALIFAEQHMSYQELNRRANQLAHCLDRLGVGPDVLVGICMERSLELVVAVLAVLKAGGAYVPLDPAYPRDRLAYMIEDAQISLLLSQTHLRQDIAAVDVRVLCLDDPAQVAADEAGNNLNKSVQMEHLAYLIYTSGSTGRPKGAMISQRNIMNQLRWKQHMFRVTAQDHILHKTAFSFDVSVWELFLPLFVGASMVIAHPEGHRDPVYLKSVLIEQAITIAEFAPAMLLVLLQQEDLAHCRSLRVLMCGGEALTADLQRQVFERFPEDVHFYNSYGPTEATINTTLWECRRESSQRAIPIGYPIANTRVYVLDDMLQPVPVGVSGELYIGGMSVGRGYHNRPDLTAGSFLPDLFSTQSGARLYKTGDLVRYRADGAIEYVGRIDNQVKLRGFRIELGEIETTLRQQTGVRDAVVVLQSTARDSVEVHAPFLLAYLVPEIDVTVRIQEIEAALQTQLPDYMAPNAFMLLDALPLTPSGKVDRRALPHPDQQMLLHQQERFVAPSTPVQEIVAQMWQDLLHLSQIGIHDNFFALGGHSLLATQVQARIRQTFQVELPVRDLFEAPTIATLAQRIERLQQGEIQQLLPALVPVAHDDTVPLSFTQERLWFLHQLDPGNMAYHVPIAVRLHGSLSLALIQQSLTHIAQRHEILRTTFQMQPSGPVQVIAERLAIPVALIDLQQFAPEQQTALVDRLIQNDAECAFHLESGPLFRSYMIRLAEQEHLLLISMHHIIYDDWSANPLLQEFVMLYQALRQGQTAALAPLPIQYADYALWQRDWMQSPVSQRQLDYWRAQLEGVPTMLDLPLDRFRNGIYNQQFRSQMVLLSPIQTEQLKLLSQQYDVTLFMTLLAALKTVLFKWSGQRDIAVGTVIAGRRYTELEPLIGCFLNFLALRTQLEPDMSWEQLVSVVKTMVLDAYTHQDLPFEKVVAELQPDRTRYHNPFYNVAFVLHNTWQRQNAFHTTGLTMELQSLPRRDALLDLRFNGVETAEGLQINCEYDASLFHDTTIHTLLEAYQQVLQQIIRDSSTALDAFSLPDRLVQQAQRARRRAQPQTLAIAATFTAEPLEAALSYWMHELQLPTKITFAAYHQVLQQLLDPQSLLATNTAGVNVILLRFEDWLRFSQSTGHGSSVRQMLEPLLDEFLQAIQQFLLRTSVSNLLCICPPSPQVQADAALNLLCQQMEQRLIQEVSQSRGITVLSSSEVLSKYTVEDYYDDYTDKAGHVPFTPRFFTALGTSIARKIAALKFQSYKVIVVDCDQTLWQGVCGEDGPQGIVIDPARRALQEFLVAQQEAGMLICLNSKNSEQDVQAVFDAHPEMPLQRHHLTALRINWLPKSQNLRALAQSLNLSLESMIFVDDNPLEQAEVQAQCPEVLIFPFPEQSAELPQRLAHFWAFDQVSRTAEDTQRTRYYQQEQQRQHFMQSTLSLADFLAHLNLQVRITSLEEQYLTRAAQLTQRTNQFNLTTIRRTEQDIRQFCHEQQGEALVIHVEDRFGAYGLVGLVLYTCTQDTLLVDTFLLSCRVLGRGVEHQIVAYLGTCAQERGLATVTLPYRPTSKNQPAADFLERSGSQFKQAQKQGWDIVFPLLIAAQLRFAPDVEPEQAQATAVATETAATKPQPSDEEHLTQAQLHHIAIHLQSVEQIYQQIQLQAPRKTVQQGMGGGKPQSAVEEGLLKIWSELLHLDTLGTEDNFFLIGGHSLLATQVLSQVRTVFQVELPLQRIFDHPTIVEMAQLIEETQRDMLGQSDDEFLAQMVMELGGVSQDDFLGLLTDIDE